MLLEITFRIRLGNREEPVVKAHFGIHRLRGADPVDGAFDFAARGRAAAFAVEVSGAAQLDYFPGVVLYYLIALDDVGIL